VIDVDESKEEDEYESEESDNEEGFVLAPDSVSKYIITRYTNKMQGKDIPWEWVVRSENGRYFYKDEVIRFREKSTASCPTYGLCSWCFGSGPTGMHCQKCRKNDKFYKMVQKRRDKKLLDAGWISRYFGTAHLVAKADRTYDGSAIPIEVIGLDDVYEFINERWENRALMTGFIHEGRRIENMTEDHERAKVHLFDDGSSVEVHGQWDIDMDRTILIVKQEDIFEGSNGES
jgi:hypothetical protein